MNDFSRTSLKSLEKNYYEIEEVTRKSIDFQMRYTTKQIRNALNSLMNKVLRPLQLKDLFAVNQKYGLLVDSTIILT